MPSWVSGHSSICARFESFSKLSARQRLLKVQRSRSVNCVKNGNIVQDRNTASFPKNIVEDDNVLSLWEGVWSFEEVLLSRD